MDLTNIDVKINQLQFSAIENKTIVHVQLFTSLVPGVRNILKTFELTFDGPHISSTDPALLEKVLDVLESIPD